MNNINNVLFDEREHTYWYEGRRMYGVTNAIQRLLGREYPANVAAVDLMRSYGSQVHKEVEGWIGGGCPCAEGLKLTEHAQWIVQRVDWWLKRLPNARVRAEVRVSDFRATASNVDIAIDYGDNCSMLFDIKTGAFDRRYCSLQLNAYRQMYELSYGRRVMDMLVLCSASGREFRIYESAHTDAFVRKIFAMNAENK